MYSDYTRLNLLSSTGERFDDFTPRQIMGLAYRVDKGTQYNYLKAYSDVMKAQYGSSEEGAKDTKKYAQSCEALFD